MDKSFVPLNPRPFEDEWFGSWLARIAHANTMSLTTLLSHIYDDPFHIRYDVQNIARLAKNFHIDAASIVATLSTALPLCSVRARNRADNVLAMHRNIKVCLFCLASDNTPYLRLKWMSRRAESCDKHHARLIERCPKCKKLLIPVGEFKSLDRTVLLWDHPVCFCQTCGFDLRSAATSFQKHTEVEYIGNIKLTTIQRDQWLDALYLMIEHYRLDLWLHPTTFEILVSPHQKPSVDSEKMRNISGFFAKVLEGLVTSESKSIDIQQLRRFGAACENLAQSSSRMRNSSKSIRWLASLIEHSKVDYLVFVLPSVIFALTLNSSKLESRWGITLLDSVWPEIKLEMHAKRCPPGRRDSQILEKMLNKLNGCENRSLTKYEKDIREIHDAGIFNAFITAVYHLHQSRPDIYKMDETWLQSGNIEYVRTNAWLIFQESMTYYGRDFHSPREELGLGTPAFEDLLNLALAINMPAPGRVGDFIQLFGQYANKQSSD